MSFGYCQESDSHRGQRRCLPQRVRSALEAGEGCDSFLLEAEAGSQRGLLNVARVQRRQERLLRLGHELLE